jgi:hypothetical protein
LIARRAAVELQRVLALDTSGELARAYGPYLRDPATAPGALNLLTDPTGQITVRSIFDYSGFDGELTNFLADVKAYLALGYAGEDLSAIPGISGSTATSPAQACDVFGRGKVDRWDIQVIAAGLNTRAIAADPRDADGDGEITVLDARQCALKCTSPNCAP